MRPPVKPKLLVIAGRPVTATPAPTKPSRLEVARARFGRPFAAELVNDFAPHPRGNVLNRWAAGLRWNTKKKEEQ